MDNIIFVLLILLSFSIGGYLTYVVERHKNKRLISKEKEKMNGIYRSLLNSVISGDSKFKSRFLNTAYISTTTSKTGTVDIVFLIDKRDIAISKNEEVKYTSHNVDKDLVDQLIEAVEYRHSSEINDVVSFFGLTISRTNFEQNFKMTVDEFNNLFSSKGKFGAVGDVTDVKEEEITYNVDDILDKISKSGIESLTKEERKYLNDYSNGNN